MTHTTSPEIFQSTIVLSDSRKDLLAAAIRDARHTMDMRESAVWATPAETAAEQRARTRAERLAWFVESL